MPDPIPHPPLSSFSPPHQANVLQKAKPGFPWVESALLVSAAALLTISILSNIDVIHHVGTLSAHFVTNAALYGGLTLTAAAAIIFLIRHYESSKEAKIATPQVHTAGQEFIVEPHASYDVQETEKSRAYHSTRTYAMYKPCAHTFEINGEEVTLYGLLYGDSALDQTIAEYEKQLRETGGDKEKIKAELAMMSDDVALKMGDKVIVSASHCVKFEDSIITHSSFVLKGEDSEEHFGKIRLVISSASDNKPNVSYVDMEYHKNTFETELREEKGSLVLFLGSPDAIKSLDNHKEMISQIENTLKTQSFLETVFKNVLRRLQKNAPENRELSLIALELSK